MPIVKTNNSSAMAQIRNLVSIAFDGIDLPDEVIVRDVFLGDANLYIQSQIPDWATLTGDNELRLEILVYKQTAVNILAAFARTKSESVEDISITNLEQLTPAQAIARYEYDISQGIKILNPEKPAAGGRYICAAIVV